MAGTTQRFAGIRGGRGFGGGGGGSGRNSMTGANGARSPVVLPEGAVDLTSDRQSRFFRPVGRHSSSRTGYQGQAITIDSPEAPSRPLVVHVPQQTTRNEPILLLNSDSDEDSEPTPTAGMKRTRQLNRGIPRKNARMESTPIVINDESDATPLRNQGANINHDSASPISQSGHIQPTLSDLTPGILEARRMQEEEDRQFAMSLANDGAVEGDTATEQQGEEYARYANEINDRFTNAQSHSTHRQTRARRQRHQPQYAPSRRHRQRQQRGSVRYNNMDGNNGSGVDIMPALMRMMQQVRRGDYDLAPAHYDTDYSSDDDDNAYRGGDGYYEDYEDEIWSDNYGENANQRAESDDGDDNDNGDTSEWEDGARTNGNETNPSVDLDSYEGRLRLAEMLGDVRSNSASEQAIQQLPTRVATVTMTEQECIVCLDKYCAGEMLRMLPCMHEYHQECIDAWLRNKGVCPICRTQV
ncbi:hypothetical protein GQ42DRAFT_165794 [Ramicandelaber brevisporus]|nr:hypothetical protein GQ42DRAFT_165794 [Ramicandelaber brevisporus]